MLGSFVKDIDRTKALYQKKNNTKFPCVHAALDFAGPEGIIDFDARMHEELHVKKNVREDKCQFCMLLGP